MSDLTKNFATAAPKNIKTKRPSTVGVPSTSRSQVPASAVKEKPVSRPKFNKNTSVLGDGGSESGDLTIMKQEDPVPNFDSVHREVAYGKFLRAMLEDCLVDEKIEREETQMDLQMAQLADRFQSTMNTMDKTNRRLKDVSLVVEQKRLLNLKNEDCTQIYELKDKSNAQDILTNLNATEEVCLDRLVTKNIDFGYDKESGHKQLLDAVNDSIEGLEQCKKHSNLDMDKVKEYEKSEKSLEELEKDRLHLENLKADFEEKFPLLSEKLLKQASEQIAKMINDEHDDDDDEDDDDDD